MLALTVDTEIEDRTKRKISNLQYMELAFVNIEINSIMSYENYCNLLESLFQVF